MSWAGQRSTCCSRSPAPRERYAARSIGRGAGYFDLDRDPAELWNAEVGTPVAGGWPVLEVDTAGQVDVAALGARLVAAARRGVD